MTQYLRYHIGEEIRRRRMEQGLTLRQLEELCGVSWVTIQRIETHASGTLFEKVEKILGGLGCELVIQPSRPPR